MVGKLATSPPPLGRSINVREYFDLFPDLRSGKADSTSLLHGCTPQGGQLFHMKARIGKTLSNSTFQLPKSAFLPRDWRSVLMEGCWLSWLTELYFFLDLLAHASGKTTLWLDVYIYIRALGILLIITFTTPGFS